MAENKPSDGAEETNLLPLEEDDKTVLSPASADAIGTLRLEIERLAQLGEEGLYPLRVLLDAVGEVVFSTGERVIAERQEEDENLQPTLILFAERNLEVLVRSLTDPDLLAAGVRYILREAGESFVVAHAIGCVNLLRTGGTEALREQGRRAYEECLRIAKERNFEGRISKLVEGKTDASGGT